MTTQLQRVTPPPQYRVLGDLANRISSYQGFSVTMDEVKGSWLRVTYRRRSILVSAENRGTDGWFYQWGNHKDRRCPADEVTAVAQHIAALLMSWHRS